MKKHQRLITTCLGVALLSGCIHVSASDIDLETTETLTLDTNGLKQLEIEATAGFLKIEGINSGSEIEVVADLAVETGNYKLSLEKRNDRAVLVADASTSNFGHWSGDSPRIDLTVKVPMNMKLKIEDGSGHIEIRNIDGNVFVKDGSGNIDGAYLHGGLEIVDGSGGIELENLKGAVEIDDGSGSIEVNLTDSSVKIEDGSGGIVLNNIGGTVNIDDGSGSLSVTGAKGHVTIDDGSGSINVKDLEDGLTVINAGSGGLSIKNVKGNVST